jgi:cysteine-rich repeat protein
MFQVLDRQAFEIVNGQIVPLGSPVPPPPHEAGWKDTVQVGPNEIVRVIMRFLNPIDPAGATFTGLFPYHCHILEHEDHEMMRQFHATTTCGDGVPGLPEEQCDDGNTQAGDGCSPACQIEESACDNGLDDDGDGAIDYPADDGCTGPSDRSEGYDCQDGIDNDGDGFIDYPADPGCGSAVSKSESPQCNAGLDNDGDGAIDFPADTLCRSAFDNNEASNPACGLGGEVVLLLAPGVFAVRWRRRSRRAGVEARGGDGNRGAADASTGSGSGSDSV